MALKSYAEVQEFISSVMEANKKEGRPPPISPHHAFWNPYSERHIPVTIS